MNYQETLDYLYSRLPVFQNIGARAFKPGLSTTIEICRSLGDPQSKYPCIHIGGTNGKGSTSHMIASILQTAGYRVGLYTSPHLKSFTERIKVNGSEISQDFIIKFTSENITNINRLNPSFFELTVAMAFSYFADSEIDIAVIEVGMGGRLDSTNIITPILSLITNVSYDHVQFLGNTLEKIAFEKAGIIKRSVPVVISEYQTETSVVFEDIADQLQAPLQYGSREFLVQNYSIVNGKLAININDLQNGNDLYPDILLDLTGSYQLKNICGVLTAIRVLNSIRYNISTESIYVGLKQVVALTGLKGRWQKIGSDPEIYCDTAHNEAGLSDTIKQFESISFGKKRFVIGFVADKDIKSIMGLFPLEADYYFTQPSNMRALKATELLIIAGEFGLKGKAYSNVNDALHEAIKDSKKKDSIYVGGSTFVVADLEQI